MQSESYLPLKSPKRFFSFSSLQGSPISPRKPQTPQTASWSSLSLPSPYAVPVLPSLPALGLSQSLGSDSQHLGLGATVVRTPADALSGSMVRRYEQLSSTAGSSSGGRPLLAAGDRAVSSPTWRTSAKRRSGEARLSSSRPRNSAGQEHSWPQEHPPLPVSQPFEPLLLSSTTRPLPVQPRTTSQVLVTLEFAYSSPAYTSLADPLPGTRITLPMDALQRRAKGSRLFVFVTTCLGSSEVPTSEAFEHRPELTDGESAYSDDSGGEDEVVTRRSDADVDSLIDRYADLDALISNEELFGEMLDSPPIQHKPLPNLPIEANRPKKKRAYFRNQQNLFPSPSSTLITIFPEKPATQPLAIRGRLSVSRPALRLADAPLRARPVSPIRIPAARSVREANLTELHVLLLRPAGPYHAIAAFLQTGALPPYLCESASRPPSGAPGSPAAISRESLLAEIEAEAEWLGLDEIVKAAKKVLSQSRPRARVVTSQRSREKLRAGPEWI